MDRLSDAKEGKVGGFGTGAWGPAAVAAGKMAGAPEVVRAGSCDSSRCTFAGVSSAYEQSTHGYGKGNVLEFVQSIMT